MDKYFGSLPPSELIPELINKCDMYYKWLDTSGHMRKLLKSYDAYYGYSAGGYGASSSDIAFGGEQGELTLMRVNHYRNLVQHLLVMVTSNRPALEARAANSDARTQSQVILANGLLEYYMRDKRLERNAKTAAEHALLFGEGYIHQKWNTSGGNIYAIDPDTQEPIYEGDVEFVNPLGPFEVVRDINVTDVDQNDWYIVMENVNRFDMAALYPEVAERVLATSIALNDKRSIMHYQRSKGRGGDCQDRVLVFRFYHRVTPAMPAGREVVYMEPDILLFDGPIPHSKLPGGLPVYRMSPGDFYGTPFGYSPAWDLIGISQIIDALYSTVATNQTSFGVQNILAPKGHDIAYHQLAGSLNLIEYDPRLGKPESLNLTHTPAEIFNFIKQLESTAEILSGVNAVVRGEPQASLKSGSALALVASQAVQFNNGLQAAYTALLEDVGTGLIRMLQDFGNTKRVASIAGKSQRYMIREFSGQDLSDINRVCVDVANPLSRTVSGRLEMARDMLQIQGLVKNIDQYLQVVETGKLTPMVEGKEAELITIRLENELLADGGLPQAIATDRHSLHISEHSTVLNTPDARENPQTVQNALTHIQSHIDLLSSVNPALLMMMGEQPLQGPPPAPPEMNNAQAMSSEGGEAVSGMAQQVSPTSPLGEQAQNVEMPSMPTNPASGQQFNPEAGQ